MPLHQRTVVLLQGSCALMAVAFAACGLGDARADVPMLTRHASFDGDLAMRVWTGGSNSFVGSARRLEADRGNRDDVEASRRSDIARPAGEALFTDGFQPSAH